MLRIICCAFIAALVSLCVPAVPAEAQLLRTFMSAATGNALHSGGRRDAASTRPVFRQGWNNRYPRMFP